jgi:putative hydrolase of the HAD superfamily
MATQRPVSERKAWRGYFSTLLRGLGVADAEREAAGRTLLEVHEREHMWTRVEDSTFEALDTLRDQGYRLGVVSNADGRMPALLDQVGLADRFEFVIDSHVVGVTKPDPRIFTMAVERLGLPAAACMYVGDLYAVDVVGARGAGLRPVLLDPFDDFDLPVSRVARVGDLPDWLGASA